jgi:hypothetical protein
LPCRRMPAAGGSFSRLALSEIALAFRRAKCSPERHGARQACGFAQSPERIWPAANFDSFCLQCAPRNSTHAAGCDNAKAHRDFRSGVIRTEPRRR